MRCRQARIKKDNISRSNLVESAPKSSNYVSTLILQLHVILNAFLGLEGTLAGRSLLEDAFFAASGGHHAAVATHQQQPDLRLHATA